MKEQTLQNTEPHIEQTLDQNLSPQPTKNLTKIVALSVIGILIAGGLVSAGIQIGKDQKPNEAPVVIQPTSNPIVVEPTNSPTPSTITNPTENWKTYKGELLTFKYPSELQVNAKMTPVNDTSISLSDGDYNSEINEETVPNRLMDITISSSQNKTRTDYYYGGYKWVSNIIEQFQTTKVIGGGGDRLELLKTIQLDGQEALVFSDQFTSTIVVTQNTNYSVVIDLLRPSIHPNKEPMSTEVFEQILSTLQFK